MDRTTQTNASTQNELTRRHKAAATLVVGLLALTALFIVIAFSGRNFIRIPNDPTFAMALWIAILFFGLGAVAFRRTKFAPMRLQDVAAVRGLSGLLRTLQKTTMLVALIGGAIAVMGFIVATMSDDASNMLRAGLVALAVLIYCYPRKAAWQRVVQGIERTGDANTPPAKGNVA